MSKTALIASSFAAGFICSAILFAAGQTTFQGITVAAPPNDQHNVSAFGILNSVPIVPPLSNLTLHSIGIVNEGQILDGLTCEDCDFINANLMYGGGSFRLKNIKVSGTTRLTLTGAAANTEALLNFFKGIELGTVVPASTPEVPIKKATVAKKPMTKLDFTPPFIGAR
jgi:hypothetical protein